MITTIEELEKEYPKVKDPETGKWDRTKQRISLDKKSLKPLIPLIECKVLLFNPSKN